MQIQEISKTILFEENDNSSNKFFENKGINKHYINLISADVFNSKETTLISVLKKFFKSF